MQMDVSKNRRRKHPKMDGENNGSKPYEQMGWFGGFPPIFGNTQISLDVCRKKEATGPGNLGPGCISDQIKRILAAPPKATPPP